MKSWAGGGPLILVYIHTHTHDILDKLRSALAEAQLKTISEEDRARWSGLLLHVEKKICFHEKKKRIAG